VSIRYSRRPSLIHAISLAGTILLFGACKKDAASDTAPAASSSAASGLSGACGQYTSRLCETAGAQSSTCQALTTTAKILPEKACAAGLAEIDYSVKKLGQARKSCDDLVAKLCGELGPKSATCAMVTEKTKDFPPEQCDNMQQHYSEVLAELRKMEGANKPLDAETQTALIQGNPPDFGPKDAKVTVVEFSDFECPYCSRAAEVVHQLREKYGKQVRFVFLQFPLSFHKNAHDAAEASLAAHAQGKFWPYHDLLFKNQSQLDRASLEGYATQVGLDLGKFKQALDQDTYSATVDAELKLGERARVDGTPTMFVNGKRVENPASFESVAQQIEQALKGEAPG
jgi:protein-disulfide isomerase